jgi:integrase
MPDYLKPLVQVAYSTGIRRGELTSLHWENLDLTDRQIRLNARETKNGEGRVIPIADELVEVLRVQLEFRNTYFPECPLVFFRTVRTKKNPIRRGCRSAISGRPSRQCVLVQACLEQSFTICGGAAVRNMVRAGVQERVAMRISGHKTRSVFDRYNIVSEDDLTEAVRKVQKYQETPAPVPAPNSQPLQIAREVPALQSRFVN